MPLLELAMDRRALGSVSPRLRGGVTERKKDTDRKQTRERERKKKTDQPWQPDAISNFSQR